MNRWEHKGVTFTISTRSAGPLVIAAARAPQSGMFLRVRPFTAVGRSEEEAIRLLKSQIELEYRKVPELTAV